jgi:hypothetical protein
MDEAREVANHLVQARLVEAPVSPLEAALNHLVNATVARHEGHWETAQAALTQAQHLLDTIVQPDHPLRLRLDFEKALVDVLRGSASHDPAFQKAAQRMLAAWPANSAWRTQVQAVLNAPGLGQFLVL